MDISHLLSVQTNKSTLHTGVITLYVLLSMVYRVTLDVLVNHYTYETVEYTFVFLTPKITLQKA